MLKRKGLIGGAIAAIALVAIIAITSISSASNNFKVTNDATDYASSSNIDKIKSIYTTNIEKIISDLNSGDNYYNILEIVPNSSQKQTSSFYDYVVNGTFKTDIFKYGQSNGITDASKVTYTCMSADQFYSMSETDINILFAGYNMIYVDNFGDKTGTSTISEDSVKSTMFVDNGALDDKTVNQLLVFGTTNYNSLLVDGNILTYLQPYSTNLGQTVDNNANMVKAIHSISGYNGALSYNVTGISGSINDALTGDELGKYFNNSDSYDPGATFTFNADDPELKESIIGINTDNVHEYKILQILPQGVDEASTDLYSMVNAGASETVTYTDSESGLTYDYQVKPLVKYLLQEPGYDGNFSLTSISASDMGTVNIDDYDFVFVVDGTYEKDTYDINASDVSVLENFVETTDSVNNKAKFLIYPQRIADLYEDPTSTDGQSISNFAYYLADTLLDGSTPPSAYLPNILAINSEFNDSSWTTMANDISKRINNSIYGDYISANSDRRYTVLELQPAPPASSSKNYGSNAYYEYHTSPKEIADILGIDESCVKIDTYSVSDFNSKIDELVNDYDMIIIGGDVSALREFKSNNYSLRNKNAYLRDYIANQYTASNTYDMYYHTGDISLYYGLDWIVSYQGQNEIVWAGNDLTYNKEQELEDFLKSGRPILFEKELVSSDGTISSRVDKSSYIYNFLSIAMNKSGSKQYNNVLAGITNSYYGGFSSSDVTNIKSLINKSETTLRPILNIRSCPITYDNDNRDFLSNSKDMRITYDIGPELGNLSYDVKLYFDADSDGRYSEDEVFATDTFVVGSDHSKTIQYELPEKFFGILPWKLEVSTQYNVSGESVSSTVSYQDYAGYGKNDKEKEKINILQIVPAYNCSFFLSYNSQGYSSENATFQYEFGVPEVGTRRNLLDQFVFADLYDFDLDIVKTNEIDSKVNNGQINLSKYDMIVIGFSDCYNGEDLSANMCKKIKNFVTEGGCLLCSHDTMSYGNDGSRPAYQLTTGGENLRVLYGQSRFSSLDTSNIYNNDTSNSNEFYTNYGNNYKSVMSKLKVGSLYGDLNEDFLSLKTNGWSMYKYFVHNTWGDKVLSDGNYNTTKVKMLNKGLISMYPFNLPAEFTVAPTHNQYLGLDLEIEGMSVWYALSPDSLQENSSTIYSLSPSNGRDSYYIYSYGNVTYTGAGHRSVTSDSYNNNDERKLFINTIFLSLAGRNNAPELQVSGSSVKASEDYDGTIYASSKTSSVSFDLKVVDDLRDKYFTGLVFIDANPDGGGYDATEDTLVGTYMDGEYYDAQGNKVDVKNSAIISNNGVVHIPSVSLNDDIFKGSGSDIDSAYISVQIFDSYQSGNTDNFTSQRANNALNSVATVEIKASDDVETDLQDLN